NGGAAGSNAGGGVPDASAGSAGVNASSDSGPDVARETSTNDAADATAPQAETGSGEADAAPSAALTCTETCTTNTDCVGKSLTDTAPYLCDAPTSRCVACKEDTACYAQFSQITKK